MNQVDKYNESKKPKKVKIKEANIPNELKKINAWVCWFWRWDGKKWTKPPCNPDIININHLQSSLSYKDCIKAYKNDPDIAGVGFSLRKDDKFCGIDFDDCLDKKGKPNKRLKRAIKLLNGAYIERSPSGAGVRVFGVGKPSTRGSRGAREIEIYNSGRYLTVTGQQIGNSKGLTNITKACKKIDKKIYKDKESYSENTSKRKNSLSIHENSNPKIIKIRQYQATYNQEDRDEWVKFGQIIHYETNGSQEGFDYWNYWSQGTTADNYSEGDAKGVWKSFKKKNKGKALTLSTLIYDYKEKFGDTNDSGDDIPEEEITEDEFLNKYKLTKKDTKDSEKAILLYNGICRETQLTIVIAPPNAGKSAIMFFRVSPDLAKAGKKVIFIDVDSAASDRALMERFAKKHNFHHVCPDGKKNTSIITMIEDLNILSYSDVNLKNSVFVIDTMKKLNDMMSKTDTKKTMDTFKRLSALGATIIVMAHSNKFADKSTGDWIYEGTNDILSQSDAMVYLYFEKNKETKDVVISTYPYKERGSIGQATFNIKGGERDLTSVEKLVNVNKSFIDVRLDNQEYKGFAGKKFTVKDIRVKVDAVILFDDNEWITRVDLEKKLKGVISREKLISFMSEFSDGKISHYKFKKGQNNQYFYKVRNV